MDALNELQATWHRDIPIAAAMGVEVLGLQNDEFRVGAALAANINVHGTAFAGSLYSLAALTGWGMIWLRLRQHELTGAIVLSKGEIDYLRPVDEDLVCRCRADSDGFDQLRDALSNGRRATLQLACKITTRRGDAVRFIGHYAVRTS